MGVWELKHKAKLEQWKIQIVECRSSGLSVRQWCEEHNITPNTYYRWEKEVFSSATTALVPEDAASQLPAAFVELPPPAMRQAPGELVASIQIGKAKAGIYSGVDPGIVKALCQVLKSC